MSEKTKFVLRMDVLAFGVPVFLITFLIDRLRPRQLPVSSVGLLIDLAIWLTAGAGCGFALWNRKQRKKQGAS
ncbi:MAG TPA: hypothetical protein VN879_11580 [Candidatus Acidoferrales bacterium]|nr:hypothetical protein [Candidatus Acidoferrales bacterium]